MKTFIRTLRFNTEDEKDRTRLRLNGLGFYCLSNGTDLDVYVVTATEYFYGVPIWW